MTKLLLVWMLLLSIVLPAQALELEAPEVPQAGASLMPQEQTSFGEGLMELLQKGIGRLRPDLTEAVQTCLSVVVSVLILSIVHTFSAGMKTTVQMAGTAVISSILLKNTNALIQLATETIQQLSEYGKLLYPVMTTAMAAQGGITTSSALYVGTAMFDAVLSNLIARYLLPMLYFFLALSVAYSACGEEALKKLGDLIKGFISWCLKILLTIFTTYMSITGVVSGTTDAAALKAAKVTISTVVPVVGGILSDSSEAILVSAGLAKNAAGIYGIFALIAVFLEPFLRIGSHYLLLKFTAALCGLFGSKSITGLIEGFSTTMGLLLAMTGSVCLLLLISTVCFMKGVSG